MERLIDDKKILKVLNYMSDIVVGGQGKMYVRDYGEDKPHLLVEITPVELAEKLYMGRLYIQALYHECHQRTVKQSED